MNVEESKKANDNDVEPIIGDLFDNADSLSYEPDEDDMLFRNNSPADHNDYAQNNWGVSAVDNNSNIPKPPTPPVGNFGNNNKFKSNNYTMEQLRTVAKQIYTQLTADFIVLGV